MSGVKRFVNKIIPKEVAPFAAPALGLALGPAGFGLTSALGAGLAGAGLGGLQNGLKGAAAGGLGAYGLAGGAGQLGTALGATGTTAQSTLGGALLGAGSGAISGGASGALKGAALGGLGGYAQGGGFDGMLGGAGNAAGSGGSSVGTLSQGSMLAKPWANPDLPWQADVMSGAAAANPYVGGSMLTNDWANPDLPWQKDVASGAANANPYVMQGAGDMARGAYSNPGNGGLTGSGFGALTRYAAPAANMLGGVQGYMAQGEMEDELLRGLGEARGQLSPFVNAEFTPGDLTQDPGYQFQLQQGQQALDRVASARGNVFSGAALKEAQQFGQGLADQTFQDAHNRWLQQQNLNLGAAQGVANTYLGEGDVRANATLGKTNSLGQMLAGVNPFQQQPMQMQQQWW